MNDSTKQLFLAEQKANELFKAVEDRGWLPAFNFTQYFPF